MTGVIKRIKKSSRRSKILMLFLLALLVFELVFGIFERTIGTVMLWTNPYRPKVGRLWKEEAKDEAGVEQVSAIIDSLTDHPLAYYHIGNLKDLIAYFSIEPILKISREDFLDLYYRLHEKQSTLLIELNTLLQMSADTSWKSTLFSVDEDRVHLFFMDNFGYQLYHSNIDIDRVQKPMVAADNLLLQKNKEYYQRIVAPEIFRSALDRLPLIYRLQIVNNPRRLLEWGNDLLQVGISPYVESGSVTVAFEVHLGVRTHIYEVQASEIAVHYLLVAVHETSQGQVSLRPPAKKGVSS